MCIKAGERLENIGLPVALNVFCKTAVFNDQWTI